MGFNSLVVKVLSTQTHRKLDLFSRSVKYTGIDLH